MNHSVEDRSNETFLKPSLQFSMGNALQENKLDVGLTARDKYIIEAKLVVIRTGEL